MSPLWFLPIGMALGAAVTWLWFWGWARNEQRSFEIEVLDSAGRQFVALDRRLHDEWPLWEWPS